MYVSLSDIPQLPVALSSIQKPLYYLTPDFAITLEVGEPMKSGAFIVPRQPISNVILSLG